MTENNILLRVKNLVKYFPVYKGLFRRQVGNVHAVDDISFEIIAGETFGLVGESGCGKTTTGRTIMQLCQATSGHIYFDGIDLTQIKNNELRRMRRRMQMIFQDPYSSLNPRMSVNEILTEPMVIHGISQGKKAREHVEKLLETVQLNPKLANRYPHEFSGGQRQRIGIARALVLEPELIICDEPISALDVSIQAQIINLLEDLQQQMGLTYLFIAHDLSMVRYISSRVAVMYLGTITEIACTNDLFNNPMHPYTQALLSAVPVPNPIVEEKRQHIILEGDVPSPVHPPSGCRFRTRCSTARELCAESTPKLREITEAHWVACHFS